MPQFTKGHSIKADWISEQRAKHLRYITAGRKGGQQKNKNMQANISATQLSNLRHSIPANNHTQKEKLPTSNIAPIYQYDVSKMSKRTKQIHRRTINIFNNSQTSPEIPTINIEEKFQEFMRLENRPHSVRSAKNKFHTISAMNEFRVNNYKKISEKQFECIMEHLTASKKLSKKQFSNGEILYWAQQNELDNDEIEMNDIIANKEYELKQKKLKLKMLQQQRYALQNDETKKKKALTFLKFANEWIDRKNKALEMIDEVFDTFYEKPMDILINKIHGETDEDNNVDFEKYKLWVTKIKKQYENN